MSESSSLKGKILEPADDASLRDAVIQAVDYRGDVTVELNDGRTIEGFLFHGDFEAAEPFVEYFPPSVSAAKERFDARLIRRIDFSGRDTADGRSWEAWVAKKEASDSE